MSAKNIVEEFFDKKVLSILKLFLFDETGQFYLREVSKKARVPVATTFRIVNKLKDMGIVEETVIKKTKLYSLSHNKDTKILSELLEEKKTVIEEFVEAVSKIDNVQMIVKHGEETKDKTLVKKKVGDIKEKYDFNIIEYVLEPGVFNQMSTGGLISGKKVILWEKSSTK